MSNSRNDPRERRDHAIRSRMTTAAVMLLARRTPYLEQEMLGLRLVVGPGSVCVDVGAAAGLYTLALSQLAGPSGQVHSVEPLTFARPVWTRVLGARDGANVLYHPLALGSGPGSGTMSVPLGRFGPVTGRSFLKAGSHGLGSNAEFSGQMTVSVEVDTLDALCARAGITRLDFMKVDVEGAELHVLEGGKRAIETLKPTILIEIEARHTERYDYSPEDIVRWLTERGYTMHIWQNGWQRADTVCLHTRNYLFRPDGETPSGRPAGAASAAAADGG